MTACPNEPRVLLCSLPWASLYEPSLGLALLAAELEDAGIDCQVAHFNLDLLRYLRADSYAAVADIPSLNEFLFTSTLDPDLDAKQLRVLAAAAGSVSVGDSPFRARFPRPVDLVEYFLHLRREVLPRYLQECADRIVEGDFTMVGMTCLFDQTMASVSLAKLLKDRREDLMIVLGGYALEGEQGREIIRSFDCVDAIVQGDGEPAIRAVALASVGQVDLAQIPNLIFRTGSTDSTIKSTPRLRADLNQSLDPDFSGYFADLSRLETEEKVRVVNGALPVETSRGCWWGQHQHCLFCGVDDETLLYRQKDPDRVIGTLERLSSSYPNKGFRIVDYILPHSYHKTLLPRLAKREVAFELSCEAKSNLDHRGFRRLKDAGFVAVQLGIESFSSAVLREMHKGVTGIQNILALKLGREFGIKVYWNLLYGMPGDTPEDYDQLLLIIPHLYHLEPPSSCTSIYLTRYSPLEAAQRRQGNGRPRRRAQYDLLFSDSFLGATDLDLDAICYYFDRTWELPRELERRYRMIDLQVDHWKKAAQTGFGHLSFWSAGDGIQFSDGRFNEERPIQREFGRAHREVYELVHLRPSSRARILRTLRPNFSQRQVSGALDELLSARYVIELDDRCLGLAVSAG